MTAQHEAVTENDRATTTRDCPSLSVMTLEGNLHGNVPDSAQAALVLVDVLNDFDFPQNEYLLTQAPELAKAIAALKQKCASAGIPCIYVNDNRGKWRSDVHEVLRAVLRPDAPGRSFVESLLPDSDDYIVLKPRHSAFFATPLDVVLQSLGAKTLIVAGVTANACVLICTSDAYVKGYKLFVPRDCVAALSPSNLDHALILMQESFNVDTRPYGSLDFVALNRES